MRPERHPILITAGDAGDLGAAEADRHGLVWRARVRFWRGEARLAWPEVEYLDAVGRQTARSRARDAAGALRGAAMAGVGAITGIVGMVSGAVAAAVISAVETTPESEALVLARTHDERFLLFTCHADAVADIRVWHVAAARPGVAPPAEMARIESVRVDPLPIESLLAPAKEVDPVAAPPAARQRLASLIRALPLRRPR